MKEPRTPKPAVSAWIVRERKRLGMKADDVAQRLRDAGYDAADTTYRTWEASRSPKPETIVGLERIFGSSAPRDDERATETPAALISALMRHTTAMEAQTAAMGELVRWLASLAGPAVAEGVAEALARAAGESQGERRP